MPGLYVGCWLDPDQAQQLWLPGGEPPERLHITLCHLGDVDELPAGVFETAAEAVQAIAATSDPLEGRVPGYGMFRGGDTDVFWAAADMPGLAELRQRVCDRLAALALPPEQTYGWTPHVTLAYLEPGTFAYLDDWQPIPLRLESITLTTSDSEQRQTWQLSKDAVVESYLTADEAVTAAADVQLMKAEPARQVVWGIVLEPEIEDAHGDIVSHQDVELAAHRFLYQRCPIGLQHMVAAPENVRPVESFIAPCDYTVDTPRGPELVRKGSWVVAVHIPDPELWKVVDEGGFSGWSIAGWGKKTPA